MTPPTCGPMKSKPSAGRSQRRGITRQTGKEPVSVQTNSLALTTLPCVVLIDEKTSGAAELLVASLSQNAHATLVGSKTAGGAVLKQRISNPDGTSRVVQIGDFLFPKTGKTGTDGIIPDIIAPKDACARIGQEDTCGAHHLVDYRCEIDKLGMPLFNTLTNHTT